MCSQLIYDKGDKIYNGEKDSFQQIGEGKTGQPHPKEWTLTTVLPHIQKQTQNGLMTRM